MIHRRSGWAPCHSASHVKVKVIDPTTRHLLARGEKRELCTRSYSVMLGYWGEPALTVQSIDATGWMDTGDLATMDQDG